MPADTLHELPLVMSSITDLMAARASLLTMHPADGGPAETVYCQSCDQLSRHLLDVALDRHADPGDGARQNGLSWATWSEDGQQFDILLIAVGRVDGHSRLQISVVFDELSPAAREQAEQVYERRAPFAVGYFRLWQVSRSRERLVQSLQAALNLSGLGVILLSGGGEIVFANHVAEHLLNGSNGLRRSRNRLHARDLGDGVRLQVAIEHVIAGNTGDESGRHAPLLSICRPDRPSLMLSVLPVEPSFREPNDVAAAVYIMDPSREIGDLLKPVCKVYRLSPVETQLACHLVGGETLSHAAEKMRVKDMTARSYLKQIFLKTDTHRQTELIQLMLSSIIQINPMIVPAPL